MLFGVKFRSGARFSGEPASCAPEAVESSLLMPAGGVVVKLDTAVAAAAIGPAPGPKWREAPGNERRARARHSEAETCH